MNCRPNDMAVINRLAPADVCPGAGPIDLTGTIVHCLSIDPDSPENDPVWLVDERQVSFTLGGGRATATIYAVPDAVLKPLRDPGDDAKDEMLRPLPHEVLA